MLSPPFRCPPLELQADRADRFVYAYRHLREGEETSTRQAARVMKPLQRRCARRLLALCLVSASASERLLRAALSGGSDMGVHTSPGQHP